MGIDYYSCNCGEIFSDCGHYLACDCGKKWCSDECAEEEGLIIQSCKLGFEVSSGGYEQNGECDNGSEGNCDECESYTELSCKYCREEDFDDSVLLRFALEKMDISREALIEEYKIQNSK